MENCMLDYIVSRVIPGSILLHFLQEDRVAEEVARPVDEHLPGAKPVVDTTKSLLVVTYSGAPYDEILRACLPFNRRGHFTWKGETFSHKPLFIRPCR